MIRSLLFAPADSARKRDRLRSLPADVAVLDLEDAVAESAKADARAGAVEALADGGSRGRLAVRVNGIRTTHFEADLDATVLPTLELLVIPKLEAPDELRDLDSRLLALEAERDIPTQVRIIALLETARGIAAAERIAEQAGPRLEAFVFGAVDYRADVGLGESDGQLELLYARSRVVNAAAIAGRGPAIDGPYLALGDNGGLRADSVASRCLGFGGRVCIHPGQLGVVNHAYGAVDEAEHAELTAIVAGFERALAEGVASIRVGARFVDYPVYTRAAERLRRHAASTGSEAV